MFVDQLGTIARSGTREFLDSLKQADAKERPDLIGQFGVGFYASFMVADKVTVLSRMAGKPEDGVRWESDGAGEYTLEPAVRSGRGTEVVLHLREGEDELLDAWKVKSIIRKYSDHISLPIVLAGEDAPERVR